MTQAGLNLTGMSSQERIESNLSTPSMVVSCQRIFRQIFPNPAEKVWLRWSMLTVTTLVILWIGYLERDLLSSSTMDQFIGSQRSKHRVRKDHLVVNYVLWSKLLDMLGGNATNYGWREFQLMNQHLFMATIIQCYQIQWCLNLLWRIKRKLSLFIMLERERHVTNGERHISIHMRMLPIWWPSLCLQVRSVGIFCLNCSTTCKSEFIGSITMAQNAILGSEVQFPRQGTYW